MSSSAARAMLTSGDKKGGPLLMKLPRGPVNAHSAAAVFSDGGLFDGWAATVPRRTRGWE